MDEEREQAGAPAPGEAGSGRSSAPTPSPMPGESFGDGQRRDRLMAALTLISGIGLILALPFALRAGSEFFMPLTAALVIAIALVPLLEWLERHRIPAPIAAFTCVLLFLTAANVALASIVVPAWRWLQELPAAIPRIQANLAPLIDFYSSLQHWVNDTLRNFVSGPIQQPVETAAAPPTSLIDMFTTTAPSVLIQIVFAVLVIFFFLAGWTRLRRSAITSRSSFGGAMATARVIQDVVDDTSAYLGTITLINLSLGLIVAGLLWTMDMPSPLMWGGIVALLNYIPYLGPVLGAMLLAVGGLMSFDELGWAVVPALIMIGAHIIEANFVTPLIVGHRLTISPVMILISLSFWGWVWGTTGALLAVPLLIIIQTVMNAAGKPDIAGFLFEHGTLVADPGSVRSRDRESRDRSG